MTSVVTGGPVEQHLDVLTEPALDPVAPSTESARMSEATAEATAKVLKALADPVRLRMVGIIAAAEDGEACVCDVTAEFSLSQPTISHHLKALREAGLVLVSKRATWSYYRLAPGALHSVAALLEGIETIARRT